MQSFREPTVGRNAHPKLSVPLPVPIMVSVATAPLLALLVSGRWVAQGLIEMGTSSEELFRGDRLPTLPPLQPSNSAGPK
ncbi:MAG: hypothetical protein AAFN40_15365 [Cyanobacteria bacterium J06560_6]